jgi:hypothetical protein
MTGGEWFQNRGPLVDIPVNGGPVGCIPATAGFQACVKNLRPLNGGIPQTSNAYAILNPGATPGEPAKMTIPPSVFGQMEPRATTHVSIIPTVVQLDTYFSLMGPANDATFVGSPNTTAAYAGTKYNGVLSAVGNRVFEKEAWMNQVGRMGLTFDWCPGVGGPTCPDANPLVNGAVLPSLNGIVSYSNANPNEYGGTMNMLLGAVDLSGGTWVKIAETPGGVDLILRNILAGMGRQHPGGLYGTIDVDDLVDGPVYRGFMTSNQTPAMTGASAGQTGAITTLGSFQFSAGADTNTNWGFPWTTGMVFVQNNDNTPSTITITGTDMRTQAGAGQITMVAGGTSHRTQSGANFTPLEVVTFTLPEPDSMLMLAVSLSVIFGLQSLSRRRG